MAGVIPANESLTSLISYSLSIIKLKYKRSDHLLVVSRFMDYILAILPNAPRRSGQMYK